MRVAHPSETRLSSANIKKEHKSLTIMTKTLLKDECMKFPGAVETVLGIDTIQNLATADQHSAVIDVKRALSRAVARMKSDLDFIFAATESQ